MQTRNRRVVEHENPLVACIKYMVAIYLFLFFVIYPLYYERKYYNMGEAKWKFFRGMTFYVKPAFFRGMWFPSLLVLIAVFTLIHLIYKMVKKEMAGFSFSKTSVTDRFMLLYLIIVLVSAMLSPLKMNILQASDLDISESANLYWGYPGWHMGLFAQIAFVALYFIISRYWHFDKMWACVYIGVSGAVYLLAALTQFRIDPLNMFDGQPINPDGDIYFLSTIGQSSWYSSYLCCLFPIGLAVFWHSKDIRYRIAAAIYSVVAWASFVTESSDSAVFTGVAVVLVLLYFSLKDNFYFVRFWETMLLTLCTFKVVGLLQVAFPENAVDPGAIMKFVTQSVPMLILTIVVAVIYLAVRKLNSDEKLDVSKLRWLFGASVTICILGFVGFVIFVYLNTMGKLPEKYLVDNIYFKWSLYWGNFRGGDWSATVLSIRDSFKDNPLVTLFGAGPDLIYRLVYAYHKDILDAIDENLVMACAHNEFLNQFGTTGIFGGIAYLGIFVASIKELSVSEKNRPYLVGIVMCVASYVLHNLYCYQQIICTPLIFILMGMGEWIRKNEIEE
ncbi:MAG: hypothetical protein K6G84_03170 [Lachnospiraceae bacterium]|nr:hypothetical protein [Lachnospiraceae bacterium]